MVLIAFGGISAGHFSVVLPYLCCDDDLAAWSMVYVKGVACKFRKCQGERMCQLVRHTAHRITGQFACDGQFIAY